MSLCVLDGLLGFAVYYDCQQNKHESRINHDNTMENMNSTFRKIFILSLVIEVDTRKSWNARSRCPSGIRRRNACRNSHVSPLHAPAKATSNFHLRVLLLHLRSPHIVHSDKSPDLLRGSNGSPSLSTTLSGVQFLDTRLLSLCDSLISLGQDHLDVARV